MESWRICGQFPGAETWPRHRAAVSVQRLRKGRGVDALRARLCSVGTLSCRAAESEPPRPSSVSSFEKCGHSRVLPSVSCCMNMAVVLRVRTNGSELCILEQMLCWRILRSVCVSQKVWPKSHGNLSEPNKLRHHEEKTEMPKQGKAPGIQRSCQLMQRHFCWMGFEALKSKTLVV